MSVYKISTDGFSCVSNAVVYDLDECIIGSNYPMNPKIETDFMMIDSSSIDYWTQHDILKIVELLDKPSQSVNTYLYNTEDNCIDMTLGNHERVVKIDLEDFIRVSSKGWTYNSSRGYIQSTNHAQGEPYIELQRFIIGPKHSDIEVVDHKNRDTFDNRRSNLRIATRSQNSHNRDKLDFNTSGIIGVHFSNNRQRWLSVIEINKKKKSKQFLTKEEAIQQRLLWEKEYLGEFAPQKELFSQYGIILEEKEYVYPAEHYDFNIVKKHLRRCQNLVNATKDGNGAHAQFLTGIRVNFDLTFTNKVWVEAERYRFLEFVSSQSTMHRITKFDLDGQYNEYVDPRIIEIMKALVDEYNCLSKFSCAEYNNSIGSNLTEEEYNNLKKEHYLKILYSNPAGFKLTARMTTNYRCLRNIYLQRKDHRLPEWREFCRWIETLPYAQEFLIN